MTRKIRFGVQAAPQNTTWQQLRETWKLIDALGYDTAWTFDHFFAILSDPSGPCFEGWISLTALAAETMTLPFANGEGEECLVLRDVGRGRCRGLSCLPALHAGCRLAG